MAKSKAPKDARALVAASISEADFQVQVVAYARLRGWLVYHTRDSRGSDAGYPDLTMVHPEDGRLVFAELKRMGKDLGADQVVWSRALGRAMAGFGVYLWRPDDASWASIREALD